MSNTWTGQRIGIGIGWQYLIIAIRWSLIGWAVFNDRCSLIGWIKFRDVGFYILLISGTRKRHANLKRTASLRISACRKPWKYENMKEQHKNAGRDRSGRNKAKETHMWTIFPFTKTHNIYVHLKTHTQNLTNRELYLHLLATIKRRGSGQPDVKTRWTSRNPGLFLSTKLILQ